MEKEAEQKEGQCVQGMENPKSAAIKNKNNAKKNSQRKEGKIANQNPRESVWLAS